MGEGKQEAARSHPRACNLEDQQMITHLPVRMVVEMAAQILSERMMPMHYKELATLAAERLLGGEEFCASDIAEDFRGKSKGFPGARLGMFYTGAPGCHVGFYDWFRKGQTQMFGDINLPKVTVPIKNRGVIEAAIEAYMRIGFMANKYGITNKEKRFEMVLTGLIIEETVKSYFIEQWPEYYRPPENHKKYEQYCDHDFRLTVWPKTYRVDVATMGKYDRDFIKPQGKPVADIHVLSTMNAQDETVTIHAYTHGEEYRDHDPKFKRSFDRMACFLNCKKHGIKINERFKTEL
jgi:hypothetical protein